MSKRSYDPEKILKLDSSYGRVCFTDQDFSLSDPLGQPFDAWYGGRDWLKSQNPAIGSTFHRDCSGGIHVFYLVIKRYNYSKATVEDIDSALQDLIVKAQENSVTKIAFSGITPSELTKALLLTKITSLVTNVELSIM